MTDKILAIDLRPGDVVEDAEGTTAHIRCDVVGRLYFVEHDMAFDILNLAEPFRILSRVPDSTDASRWESGFRSIVTIMVGPSSGFDVPDIVHRVRALKEIHKQSLIGRDALRTQVVDAQNQAGEQEQRAIRAERALEQAYAIVGADKQQIAALKARVEKLEWLRQNARDYINTLLGPAEIKVEVAP